MSKIKLDQEEQDILSIHNSQFTIHNSRTRVPLTILSPIQARQHWRLQSVGVTLVALDC
ncbi:MAG: hypothetical protein ACI9J4_001623 [Paraglaciecola sp.]|jgi:hypothetical protein